MAKKHKRTRLWIDPAFQARLLVRQVAYWLLIVVVWIHIAYVFEVASNILRPQGAVSDATSYTAFLWRQRFLMCSVAMLLPVVLYDLLKFSHRIAGPLYRCRKLMDDMAAGKPVPEFQPRKNDLMRELVQSFAALIRVWNARLDPGDAVAPAPPEKVPTEAGQLVG